MKRVLFLIHDLGQGGAEKVLINLVNNMDKSKFRITVMALFGGGVNERFLSDDVEYITVFKKSIPGNSKLMLFFSPEQLHSLFIKDEYDIEISYLEGPSARIISGCTNDNTKLVSWIHCTMHSKQEISKSFRNYREAKKCYQRFDISAFVSEEIKKHFMDFIGLNQSCVLYNTNESKKIQKMSTENLDDNRLCGSEIKLVGIGKLEELKGFDRLIRIHKRLLDDGYRIKSFILGIGSEENSLRKMITDYEIDDSLFLLGYQTNPYKYLSKCDLFVCCSKSEGFSTATTEALIVGLPVCTVEVSGMREMLGENEYGMIVDNNEEALYEGIKVLLKHPEKLAYYKEMARTRGKRFSTEKTVQAVENMLLSL